MITRHPEQAFRHEEFDEWEIDPGGLIAGGGRQGHAFEGSEDESDPGARGNGLEALENPAEAKVANDVESDVIIQVNRVRFDNQVIVLRRGDSFSEPFHQQRDRGFDSPLLRPQRPRHESSIHHLAHPRVVCDIGGCDHVVRLARRGGGEEYWVFGQWRAPGRDAVDIVEGVFSGA